MPTDSGSLQESIVAALAQVVAKLAALRVGIADEETSKPWFVHISSIDLAQHVEWKAAESDEDLLSLIENQNSRPWPDVRRRPPWMLVVATNGTDDSVDIVFACHHALGDGKSALLFHSHLLEALNHPSDEGPALHGHVLTVDALPDLVPAQRISSSLTRRGRFCCANSGTSTAPRGCLAEARPRGREGR